MPAPPRLLHRDRGDVMGSTTPGERACRLVHSSTVLNFLRVGPQLAQIEAYQLDDTSHSLSTVFSVFLVQIMFVANALKIIQLSVYSSLLVLPHIPHRKPPSVPSPTPLYQWLFPSLCPHVVVSRFAYKELVYFGQGSEYDSVALTVVEMDNQYALYVPEIEVKNFITDCKNTEIMVKPAESYLYCVYDLGQRYIVDIEHGTCHYGRYQIDEIPYPHGISILESKNMDVKDYGRYCSKLYRPQTIVKTYELPIVPMPNKKD
ncbi:hypothetical protein FXO37_09421 [Capsicum annuum]|nr:hypothetical protein FXO37_09421 [Capsicum annuum]